MRCGRPVRRLGAAPVRWLFDLLRGPATAITAGSGRWRGLLVCAIDGTTMTVPDSARNLAGYGKQAGSHGGSGYPLLRLVALVACGTRTIIDAVFGPASCGELDYTRRLARSLHAGMIVLLDRNFGVAALIGRARRHRGAPAGPPQEQPQTAGAAPLPRRVVPVADRRRAGAGDRMRDHHRHQRRAAHRRLPAGHHPARLRRYPAAALITLYHQRWEIEMVFTQLAKRAVRPLGGGREHVADLHLVAGDDHAVDEQFGEQPPLLEGGGGEAGPGRPFAAARRGRGGDRGGPHRQRHRSDQPGRPASWRRFAAGRAAGHAAHGRILDGRPRPRRNAAAHHGLPCPGGQPLPAARRPPRPVPATPARWPHHRATAGVIRGGLMVARQKIHAGMIHAGKTATVICENNHFRVVIDGETAAVVPRTTTSEVHRYKANATDKRSQPPLTPEGQ